MNDKKEPPWLPCAVDKAHDTETESKINTIDFLKVVEWLDDDSYELGYFIPAQEAAELWEIKQMRDELRAMADAVGRGSQIMAKLSLPGSFKKKEDPSK